jgi:hypothetical protein
MQQDEMQKFVEEYQAAKLTHISLVSGGARASPPAVVPAAIGHGPPGTGTQSSGEAHRITTRA